jgi:hypothetical protein
VAAAGVEPHVEDVGLLAKAASAALRTPGTRRQQLGRDVAKFVLGESKSSDFGVESKKSGTTPAAPISGTGGY